MIEFRQSNKFWFLLLTGVLMAVSLVAQQTAGELFEKALYLEEGRGEPQQAIDLYQKLIKDYPENREVVAKAVLHLGFCFEKMGQQQAREHYQRVVDEFPEQTEAVAAARARIVELKTDEPLDLEVVKLPKALEVPHFSRDGTKAAGVDWSVPGQNISVYDYATNQLTPLTRFDWGSEGHGITYYPLFSPDATEVAYWFKPHNKEISELRASTLDGEVRTLFRSDVKQIIPCDWFSDGSALLTLLQSKDNTWQMGLVPAEGGEFEALSHDDALSEGGLQRPTASPDGKYIIYAAGPQGKRDIFVKTRRGDTVGRLTTHPANDGNAVWSPDGRFVVFKSNRTGSSALWGVEVREGKAVGQPFMLKPQMENTGLLNWTSLGLACEMYVVTRDVFLLDMDAETNEPLCEARMLDFTPTGNSWQPAWSPDGKHLTFATSSDAYQMVILPASGGEPAIYPIPIEQFRRSMPWFLHLRWLPDSSGLGFLTRFPLPGDTERRLFRLDLATKEWESWLFPLTLAGTWGRDDRSYIYAKTEDGNYVGFVERDLSSGEERFLYRIPDDERPAVLRDVKLSRDNTKLAFYQYDLGVLVLDIASGEIKRVGSQCSSPAWSPDGRFLVALDTTGKGWPKKMVVLKADGMTRKELNLGSVLPKGCELFSPDWSTDGKQIAFQTRSWFHENIFIKNVIPNNKK